MAKKKKHKNDVKTDLPIIMDLWYRQYIRL